MTRQLSNQTQQQTATTSPLSSGILQRKCVSCGQHTIAGGECEGCQKKRSPLQRRSANQAELSEVPPIVHEVLRSPTQPSDQAAYALMEPRLRHDFRAVPVHSVGKLTVQPKLTINQPGDKYEQEADRIADSVMQMPESLVQAGRTPEITQKLTPVLQRQVETELGEDEEEEEEEAVVQLKKSSAGVPLVSPNVASRIESLQNGGHPLSQSDRAFFEPRFGYDFSRVRIHSDEGAAKSARELGARAFTIGHHVVFGAGQYIPHDDTGRHLLAHELTHVIQQTHYLSQPTIQRDPDDPPADAIKQIEIYLAEELVVVTTHGGKRFHLLLNREKTNLKAGTYQATHKQRQEVDLIEGLPNNIGWFWNPDPKGSAPDPRQAPDSKYNLIVYGSFQEAESRGTGGKGQGGTGGDKKGKEAGTGDKQGTSGAGEAANDKALLDELQQTLKSAGVETTGSPNQDLLDLLKSLNPVERKDLLRLLIESQSENATPIDLKQFADFYKKLPPSQRELLRVNLELTTSETTATSELPSEVKLNLEVSAKTTSESGEKVNQLNKQLEDLARIQAKVTDETLLKKEKANLDPIDLAKLPVFNEMMMLQGLLAGASTKSPEIEAIAKQITQSISEIRSYVLEEIAWLAGELALGSVISVLLAPVSAGASVAAASTRAVLLIRRLNKLREFLQQVERIYSTYQTIQAIIIKVTGLIDEYHKFKAQYDLWIRDLEAVKAKLDAVDLDADSEEKLSEELERLEELLIDELQKQLDSGSGLGALLDHFYIPENATEEDLKEILFNIPRGIEALKELSKFYASGKRGDIEFTRTLAFKSVRVGVLLYPFVGYLAAVVSNQLGTLMQDKDLSERLLAVIGRGAARGSNWKVPGRAKTRSKLKTVKKPSEKKAKSKDSTEKKPSKGKGKKPKSQDEAKKDPKDKDKDEKPKGKEEEKKDPSESEWQLVVAKVSQLKEEHKTDGITKANLLKQARSIRKQHKTVANSPKVSEVPGSGYWRVRIPRKGKPTIAEAEVLMSIRVRWTKGQRAIETKLAGMTANRLDKTAVGAEIAPFKEKFGYQTLKVGNRQDKKQGLAVSGKMGNDKEREIALIEDVTDLHFGTQNDPIPVHWYKHQGNYPKEITLRVDGQPKRFPMNSTDTLDLVKQDGTEKVRIGIDMQNLIEKHDVIQRESRHKRSGTKQENYRKALKQAGYNLQTTGMDADHVQDLAFQGKDDYDNLWPLNSEVNRHAYTEKWYMDYGIEYRDPKNPLQTLTSTLYRLKHKFFKVIGFQTKPKVLGGRTNQWKSPDKP